MNLPERIQTESNLRQYLSYMIDILGWVFHPDDYIGDYVNDDGSPIFNEEEVVVMERLMEESFDFCEQKGKDIYEVSMAICTEIHGDIFEMLHEAYTK